MDEPQECPRCHEWYGTETTEGPEQTECNECDAEMCGDCVEIHGDGECALRSRVAELKAAIRTVLESAEKHWRRSANGTIYCPALTRQQLDALYAVLREKETDEGGGD